MEAENFFTEKELDGETGLTYFGARYLDAELGSWTAVDPMGQYHHGYSFVGGDPVNYVDVLGLEGESANGKWDDSFWDLFQDRGGTWVEDGTSRPSQSADASNVVVNVPQPKNYEAKIQAPPPGHPAAEPLPHMLAREAQDWYKERYAETGQFRYAFGRSIVSIYLMALPETEDESLKSMVGGGRSTNLLKSVRVIKAINLPGWNKISVDMVHIAERHMTGGALTSGRTVFTNLNEKGVVAAIRQAYSSAKTIHVQGERVLLSGTTKTGMNVEMWLNKTTNMIETAYPVFP